MINLLSETLSILRHNGLEPENVSYVQLNTDIICSWDIFAKAADEVFYDNGYGGVEVNSAIKIIGCGWWLERREYDGAEWWEYCEPPYVNNSQKIDNKIEVLKYLKNKD